MRLEFEEVMNIFYEYKIWCSGRELLWYKKAWEQLKKEKLTEHNNYLEECMVKIRIFTIMILYQEFCELAFDEGCSYEFYDWSDWSGISEFRIGQLIGRQYNDEFLDDECEEDTADEGFKVLVEGQRYRVFNAIKKGVGVHEMFVMMYLATINIDEEECNDTRDSPEEEIEKEYKRYEEQVECWKNQVLEWESYNLASAWEWICNGSYRLG